MKRRVLKEISYLIGCIAVGYVAQLIVLTTYLLIEEVPGEDIGSILSSVVTRLSSWIIPTAIYILYLLIRFWVRSYRRGKVIALSRSVTYSLIVPILLIYGANQLRSSYVHVDLKTIVNDPSWLNASGKSLNHFQNDSTFRSIHVFGLREFLANDVNDLVAGGYEQVVLVPYAYMENIDDPNIRFNGQRSGRRDSSFLAMTDTLHSRGIQVIIKPHLWLGNPEAGKWRADITMVNEEAWQQWEKFYLEFILHHARLSEQIGAPIYCIGNELIGSTTVRPQFWISLIEAVRKVYHGKLTYGANWDREVFELPFWDQLDYIGIQAYFPLADGPTDDLKQISKGWRQHSEALEKLSQSVRKPIIFTEIGYKSTENAAHVPWEWENQLADLTRKVSMETQSNCYKAFFQEIWHEPWMKGIWIWKWEGRQNNPSNHDFTPKGKSAYYEIARNFTEERP